MSIMEDLAYAENEDMYYMYGRINGYGRPALEMYCAQYPDRRIADHIIFQWLDHQLRETRSFHVTRHTVGQQRQCTQSKPGRKRIEL
ncbi:hypothetical protein TNCV_5054761 [Trichonephila clavipes]|nr:hypothetical protein TNCV_5054761 [Trichonephila clavipes]